MHTISLAEIAAEAEASGRTPLQVMCCSLDQGVWPLRFVRNSGVFSTAQQCRLLTSKAAIIGCGGLGGHVATLLARAGVGALVLCDGDTFSESNLNRQLVCRESNLGRNKAQALAGEIAAIASHISLSVYPENLTAQNAATILQDADIVLDCLDSIPARLLLQKAAQAVGLNMIHAALAGEEGFFALVPPGADTLGKLYNMDTGSSQAVPSNNEDAAQRIHTETSPTATAESILGVPTVTPAATAALQAALALQVLGGQKEAIQPAQPAQPGEPEKTGESNMKKQGDAGKQVETGTLYHLDLSALTLEGLRY